MNVTRAEVAEAEAYLRAQRKALAPLLRLDKRKAGNPADIALGERVMAAAKGDFTELENLLTFPEVNALFVRDAIYSKLRR